MAQGYGARDRMGRVAAAFTFVGHLVDVPQPPDGDGQYRDGVDVLLALAGEQEGPAVILAALLLALGEKASVDYAPGMAFVRIEIDPTDLPRVPPFARLVFARGRCYLPLDASAARGSLGVLRARRR
ncbi:MAG TPA: hypothetical protein VFM88_11680 [Vicinamibacteria bacterium]|nr:hypothetical protein [Vicinamibacteria bacterium]